MNEIAKLLEEIESLKKQLARANAEIARLEDEAEDEWLDRNMREQLNYLDSH